MKSNTHTLPQAGRLGGKRKGSFSHWTLLLYWPVFGLLFALLERGCARSFRVMHCALDDAIPFCEWFLIPYLFWFVFLAGMHLYTFFFEPEAFRGLMRFIMASYTLGLVMFVLFPSCQHLRPVVFPRDNLLTRLTVLFYQFDTNTNVCPSLHVVGSAAVAVCAWKTKRFSTPGWKAAFAVTAGLISVSTLFLKQHSATDVLAAIPVCLCAYALAYGGKKAPARRTGKALARGGV